MAAGRKEQAAMSVIGRLDKQVEEVLITPLEKHNQPPATRDNAPPREDSTHAETESQSDAQEMPRSRSTKEEMPVWLL
jgi:hypothetical protein